MMIFSMKLLNLVQINLLNILRWSKKKIQIKIFYLTAILIVIGEMNVEKPRRDSDDDKSMMKKFFFFAF